MSACRFAASLLLVTMLLAACGDDDAPATSADASVDASVDAPRIDAAQTDAGDSAVSRDLGDCVDEDGDGVPSTACGGTDCDDTDARRYPGASEVCDPDNLDEDCNASTYGFVDLDADGANDARCCNVSETGADICGEDCDDTRRVVNPLTTEVCDGFDNDCDGVIDEVASVVFLDCDGDGFGSATMRTGCETAATTAECSATVPMSRWVSASGDCDDTQIGVYPGATERCNGRDDDCAAPLDPPTCGCTDGASVACGFRASDPGRCSAVTVICSDGSFSCPGAGLISGAEPEVCNGIDDNCRGGIDEGVPMATCYRDADRDGYAAAGAALTPRCACVDQETTRAPSGGNVDCNDADGAVRPGAPESCNVGDDDCDGSLDEGVAACAVRITGRRPFGVGSDLISYESVAVTIPSPAATPAFTSGYGWAAQVTPSLRRYRIGCGGYSCIRGNGYVEEVAAGPYPPSSEAFWASPVAQPGLLPLRCTQLYRLESGSFSTYWVPDARVFETGDVVANAQEALLATYSFGPAGVARTACGDPFSFRAGYYYSGDLGSPGPTIYVVP